MISTCPPITSHPRTQHLLTLPRASSLQQHLQSLINFFYSTAEEGHSVWPKASPLFPNYQLSAAQQCTSSCQGKCRSVSPIKLIIILCKYNVIKINITHNFWSLSPLLHCPMHDDIHKQICPIVHLDYTQETLQFWKNTQKSYLLIA